MACFNSAMHSDDTVAYRPHTDTYTYTQTHTDTYTDRYTQTTHRHIHRQIYRHIHRQIPVVCIIYFSLDFYRAA